MINPQAVDASNGTVQLTLSQKVGTDTGDTLTVPTGATFNYELALACASTTGPCLTGGVVKLDLSAWKGYSLQFGANDANVLSHNWDPDTGILTLNLANIGLAGSSFTWPFSITTPTAIKIADPTTLAFKADLTATDFEPQSSNTITSNITAVLPETGIAKSVKSSTVESGSNSTWEIRYTSNPGTGVYLPQSRTITDVLPAGVNYVSCLTKATTHYEACTYDEATRTVTFPTKDLTPPNPDEVVGEIVTNVPPGTANGTVFTNTAKLDEVDANGVASHKEATATVTVAAPTGNAERQTNRKAAEGAILHNFSTDGVPKGNLTHLGNWRDDGGGLDTEGWYYVEAGYDYYRGPDALAEVVDDLPCLDNKVGANIYTSDKSGKLCQNPAFYMTGLWMYYGHLAIGTRSTNWFPKVQLSDGTIMNMVYAGTNQWKVPTSAIGKVARVLVQADFSDPKKPKGISVQGGGRGSGAGLRLVGIIPQDKGIQQGDLVRNNAAETKYLVVSDGSLYGAGRTPAADLKVTLSTVGVNKYVCPSRANTEPTATWCIDATFRLGLVDLAGPYVTVTDLWPKSVPLPDDFGTKPQRWCVNNTCADVPTRVQLDYSDTQHLLQWKVPVSIINAESPGAATVTLSAKLPTVTLPLTGTANRNTVYLQMANDDNPNFETLPSGSNAAGAWNQRVADPGDLDNDPTTAFAVMSRNDATRSYLAGASSYRITKSVKGDLDTTYKLNPARGVITPSGSANFRLTFTNTGAATLKNSVLYDILPYPGDVGPLLTDQRRGSTFATPLTGVGQVPPGVTLAYSQSTNPCRPELIADADNPGCVDDWTTTAPALDTVKALRWINTNAINTNASWTVDFSAGVPAGITDPDISWNMVAGNAVIASTNTEMQPVQAPRVGIRTSQTGDLVWEKRDQLGNLLGGSEWQLTAVDSNGDPLTGADAYSETVVDDTGAGGYTGLDIDPEPGMLRVERLKLGVRYRLVETKAPAGYAVDSSPHYSDSARDVDWGPGAIANQPNSAITLVKTADQPTQKVGDTVTYTFTATNTGDTTLANVVISEKSFNGAGRMSAIGNCKIGVNDVTMPVTLAPGAVLKCTATYLVEQADLDRGGNLSNVADVTGDTPSNEKVTASDDADVPSVQNPAIDLKKVADRAKYAVGDQIKYTLTATNTGDVTLTNVTIKETDFTGSTPLGGLSCDPATPASLAPKAVLTCTVTYTATQTDVDKGSILNTAQVEATPPSGPVLTDDDTATVTSDRTAGIDLTKTADKTDLVVGEQATFTLTAKNTGTTTLTGVSITERSFTGTNPISAITDCKVDGVAATMPATLPPGSVLTCIATYLVSQEDVDRGAIINRAHVTGTPPTPRDPSDPPLPDPTDDAEVKIDGVKRPALKLDKIANRTEYTVGDKVTYGFTATNIGNVTLTNVVISETAFNGSQRMTSISGCTVGGWPVIMPVTLAPGQQLACTASYIATQADVDRRDLANSARVVGTPPTGPTVTADDKVVINNPKPGLALEKRVAKLVDANRNGLVDAGDQVWWRFRVTNTGTVKLTRIAVEDKLLASSKTAISCPRKELAAGASMTCVSKQAYTITARDAAAGKVANTAVARGVDPQRVDVRSRPASTVTLLQSADEIHFDTTPGSGGGELPFTGFAGGPIAVVGGLLAILGAVVLVGARRRRADHEV